MFVVKGRRQGAKATGGGGTKLGETPTGLQMGEPIKRGAWMKGRPPGVIFLVVAAGKMDSTKGGAGDGQNVGVYVSVPLTHNRAVVKGTASRRPGFKCPLQHSPSV